MSEDVTTLRDERDRALAALWRIRMAAETWRIGEPAGPFCNSLIVTALGGMGRNKRLAQELAAQEARHFGRDVTAPK